MITLIKELSSYRHDFTLFLIHCGKSQAYKLLGSFDFLGNPLGLAHDIKEGFSGVMRHGDLTSVIQGRVSIVKLFRQKLLK